MTTLLNKFYIVWNPNGRNPAYKHTSYKSALDEAKRLAASNAGQEFIVLAPMFKAKKNDVVVSGYDNIDYPRLGVACELDDGIPF